MPLIPNAFERFVLRSAQQAPGPSLDLFGALGLRVATAAARSGVFEALRSGPMSAGELADRLDLDAGATETLLDLLEPLGYVRARRGRYAVTEMTRKWMLEESAVPHVHFLRWWDEVAFRFWDEQLDTVLRHGEPTSNMYDWLDSHPEAWVKAQRGFESVAKQLAPLVAPRVDLSGAKRLLDLGGGHGLYAIEMCRRHPRLEAVIFDKPRALERAQANIAEAGMTDRVTTLGGDILADEWEAGFDAVLVFNLVHGFSKDANAHLLGRVHRSLKPGGKVIILDQFSGWLPGRLGPFILRFLAFAYLVAFQGKVYASDEVLHWLIEVGFGEPKLTRFLRAPGIGLISADA